MQIDSLSGSQALMPVVFFGHGSPTIIRETNDITREWKNIAQSMAKPRGILVVSAHWITDGTAVTAMESPKTIHDFGRGLGADLFSYSYDAPGAPWLARRVQDLLQPDIRVRQDHQWGLDHGTWSVLLKAFPDADVPVVQLSMDQGQSGVGHMKIGASLAPLREEGILIVGSGNIVHNLQVMEWSDTAQPYDWANSFNEVIKKAIDARDWEKICNPMSEGASAAKALPTSEHYLPLLYAYGAASESDGVRFNPDFIQYKSLSMTSVTWAPRRDSGVH